MWHHPFTVLSARSAPPGPDRRDVAAVHRDQRFNGGPLLITYRSTCARGDRIGGHAGWSAPGLRSAARQYGGLSNVASVPRQDQAAIRPRSAGLGHGSWHSNGSGAGPRATWRSVRSSIRTSANYGKRNLNKAGNKPPRPFAFFMWTRTPPLFHNGSTVAGDAAATRMQQTGALRPIRVHAKCGGRFSGIISFFHGITLKLRCLSSISHE
jgi:hypothetical protein